MICYGKKKKKKKKMGLIGFLVRKCNFEALLHRGMHVYFV